MNNLVETGLPPKAPSGLTAAAVPKTQINLMWADNSSDETGFKVERSTDGLTYTQFATLAVNSRSYANVPERREELLLSRQCLQRQRQLRLRGGRQRDDAHKVELSPRGRALRPDRAGV